MQSQMKRTKENICKWELGTDTKCKYGKVQTSIHQLECQILSEKGERKDFQGHQLTDNVIKFVDFRVKK